MISLLCLGLWPVGVIFYIWHEIRIQNYSFPKGYPVFPGPFVEKLTFPCWMVLILCWTYLIIYVSLLFQFSFLFFFNIGLSVLFSIPLSICLPLWQYHNLFWVQQILSKSHDQIMWVLQLCSFSGLFCLFAVLQGMEFRIFFLFSVSSKRYLNFERDCIEYSMWVASDGIYILTISFVPQT